MSLMRMEREYVKREELLKQEIADLNKVGLHLVYYYDR